MSPPRPRNPVWAFAWRVFAWLVPSFALWYLVAPWHARLAGALARALVDLYAPGLVSAVEYQDGAIAFLTTVRVHAGSGNLASLIPEVNPLLYTYGLALALALLLASRASWWKLVAAAVALLPFQAWGIAFDLIAQVGVRMSGEIALQAGIVGWRREFAALGFQLGSLILPALAPIAAWAVLERRRIAELAGRASRKGAE